MMASLSVGETLSFFKRVCIGFEFTHHRRNLLCMVVFPSADMSFPAIAGVFSGRFFEDSGVWSLRTSLLVSSLALAELS